MSATFYNANGTMIGGDFHDFFAGEPPAPPVKLLLPHLVIGLFNGACDSDATRLKDVTSSGHPTLQKEFKLVRVLPHLPPPAVPYVVIEPVNVAMIIVLSGSTAILGVASVTGKGQPLAVCIQDSFGTNLNCGDPIDLLSDVVVNESTVLTQPTDADFAEAIFTFALNGLIGKLVGDQFEKYFGDTWKDFMKKKLKERLVVPIRKWLEDQVKSVLNDKAKDIKDKIKGQSRAKATLSSLGVTHV